MGRCSAGDRKVLSTAVFAPTALARVAMAAMSTIRMSGLLGVSTRTNAGFFSMAADGAASSL